MMAAVVLTAFSACSDSESYSNLLKKEEKACNWYLSGQRVCNEIPADSVFETGKDAPFYKLDDDGYVYMQVVNPGSATLKPKKGDVVYFRYEGRNIRAMYTGGSDASSGNGNDMQMATAQIVYDDYSLQSTINYGKGIQMALSYLGYESEVNLVLRSYYGFTSNQSQCIPLLINIRYFKAQY